MTAQRPAFGKKVSSLSPAGQKRPAGADQLSPAARAFLEGERQSVAAPARSAAGPAKSAPLPSAMPWESRAPQFQMAAGAGKPVWGRRIIALLIDSLIVGVPVFLFFGTGIIGAAASLQSEEAAAMAVLTFWLILGGTSIVYSVTMEASSRQATLGKMAVGAIVTDVNGGKPTLGAVIMRNTLGRFCANVIPFSIGYLIGAFRADKRCIHDLMSGTTVCRRAPAGGVSQIGAVFA